MRQLTVDGKKFNFEPKTDEAYVAKEIFIDECYGFSFKPTDVVLNLGGHIGGFDVWAYDKVAEIVTYEPSKANYDKLLANLELNGIKNVTAINAAVSDHDGLENFHDGESGHNSITMGKNPPVAVRCVSLATAMASKPFTKVKCDIEGGEYVIFPGFKVPETVNEIWFETHRRTEDEKSKHEKLIAELNDQGFDCYMYRNDPYDRTYAVKCVKNPLNR